MRAAWVGLVIGASGVAAMAGHAAAQPAPAAVLTTASEAAAAPRRHLVYAELLGKGGPYGVGYELALTPRVAIGAVGSFAVLGGQQLTTIAPYVHARLLGRGRHAWFGDLGIAVIHSRLPSPVPEWDGMTETGLGAQAAMGWEWRPGRVVARTSVGTAAGKGGIAPFLGVAIGMSL